MAYSFNGSTDRIDFANPWNPAGSALTIGAWVYVSALSSAGYITNVGLANQSYGVLVRTASTSDIALVRDGSTDKSRRSDNGQYAAGAWHHWMATDPATSFNDGSEITLYIDGTEVSGYAAVENGVSESQCTGYHTVGGRYNDDSRNFNGYIAELAHWNRVLSAGERAMLVAGFSPLFIPSGLQVYTPLIRTAHDWKTGSYGNLDGTSVVAHMPKIIYPTPSVMMVMAAAAAGGVPEQMMHYARLRRS